MIRWLAAMAFALALVGCGATGAPAGQPGTGVQGTVTIGPTCPVERINSPCPPRPMAATVVVKDNGGVEVTRFRSGSDGRFKVDLQPGQYSLLGQSSGNAGLPRPIPVNVTVTAGAYTQVAVQFDSGIR